MLYSFSMIFIASLALFLIEKFLSFISSFSNFISSIEPLFAIPSIALSLGRRKPERAIFLKTDKVFDVPILEREVKAAACRYGSLVEEITLIDAASSHFRDILHFSQSSWSLSFG